MDPLKKEIDLSQAVLRLIRKLEEFGYEAYVVGGCVRDSLRGVVPKDWDLCTSALPEQAMACFEGYHIIPTGIRHGTITVMVDHTPYEITTFRKDGTYSDNRHPDQTCFISSLQEDLARRDFTINAMAYHPSHGIIDSYGGMDDLEKKQIRCVGDAGVRFREDALRMMRALRFASQFGFSICGETEEGMWANVDLLSGISAERIGDEFQKLILGSNVEHIFWRYIDAFAVFIPELAVSATPLDDTQSGLNLWKRTAKAMALAPEDLAVRLTLFFETLSEVRPCKSTEMVETIMKRMRFDNVLISQVTGLVGCSMPTDPLRREIKRSLRRMGQEQFGRLMAKSRAAAEADADAIGVKEVDIILGMFQDILDRGECFCLQTLAISGRDLLEAGAVQGIEMGRTLNQLLDRVIDGEIENEKEILIKAIYGGFYELDNGCKCYFHY